MKKQPGKNSNPLSNVQNSANKKAADYSRTKLQAKSEARRTIPVRGVGYTNKNVGIKRP